MSPSQCFLLTPKLLPGLPFTRDITVLTIMNGHHIEAGLPKTFNKVGGGWVVCQVDAPGRCVTFKSNYEHALLEGGLPEAFDKVGGGRVCCQVF